MAILEVRELRRSFGSLRAVDGLTFSVEEGQLTAMIGPNGAGKTTFYNLVTGRLKPTGGEVLFRGERISGLPVHEIVRKGVGRSFQVTNIFPSLTVLENVAIAVIIRTGRALQMFRRAEADRALTAECLEILEMVGLQDLASRRCDTLSYGDRRRVEIALVLASRPSLVMLDEPTAGMNPEETRRIVELIKNLAATTETTFFLTEHDMEVVFAISDRILVLHRGRLLADGTPAEIRENEAVREAYLGGAA